MARYNPHLPTDAIYPEIERWCQRCFVGDGSILSGKPQLWTAELFQELKRNFVENPDEGGDSFYTKLEGQLRPGSAASKQLMAEILWLVLIFSSNITAQKKRQSVIQVWNWSGEAIDDHQTALSDIVLGGIGSTGMGFNNHRWRELNFVIHALIDVKGRPETERSKIASSPEEFCAWLDLQVDASARQLRHILPHLLFPDNLERISSGEDKRRIIAAFHPTRLSSDMRRLTNAQLDKELESIRHELEAQTQGPIDFYMPEVKAKWKPAKEIDDDGDREAAPIAAIKHASLSAEVARDIIDRQLGAPINLTKKFGVWKTKGGRDLILPLEQDVVTVWTELSPELGGLGMGQEALRTRPSFLKETRLQAPFGAWSLQVASADALIDLLEWYAEEPAVPVDQRELDRLRKQFLLHIPGFTSFQDRANSYWPQEREYKEEILDLFQTLVVPIIDNDDRSDESAVALVSEYRRVLTSKLASTGEIQNLVNWRALDLLKRPKVAPMFGRALKHLLSSTESLERKFEVYLQEIRQAFDPDNNVPHSDLVALIDHGRGLGSLALMLLNPKEAIIVRFELFDSALRRLTRTRMPSNSDELGRFSKATELAKVVFHELESWGWAPKDMMDVQSFLWVALKYDDQSETDPDGKVTVARDHLSPDMVTWFCGHNYGGNSDQTDRFIADGTWDNGSDPSWAELVNTMEVGDKIALKSSYVRKHNLRFDNRGAPVSVMAIKAVGTITANDRNGESVEVSWTRLKEKKEWYFYTNRQTMWRVRPGEWMTDGLIKFAFYDKDQDIERFLSDPYWRDMYHSGDNDIETDGEAVETTETYAIEDIIKDGCFIDVAELKEIIACLETKLNVILQGPPGTGKTWLARRLGYALIGQKDDRRIRVVQFHPNLSYEDFVRGYRPSGDGKLSLVDGVFMEAITEAKAFPQNAYVVVIEEINRGNPAQIFGEMLTLLEADKRRANEAIQLSYRMPDSPHERVFVPPNLYVIGTMNVADRSLALVDLALRRRFAFVDLEPQLGELWQAWMSKLSISESDLRRLQHRMTDLNATIEKELGKQFCIGHSYVTPPNDSEIADFETWFTRVAKTEIRPLLNEYWFEQPQRVEQLISALLAP